MKKILIAALLVAGTLGVFAQGTVTFNNSATSLVIDSTTGVGAASGSRWLLALYYGVAGTSSDAGVVQIGGTTTIFPSAGRYSGGTRTTLNTTAPGASAVFQVRGWEAAYGSTYEAALANPAALLANALFGKSALFTSATGGAGTPPSAAVALSATVPGFTLVPVPEPSTIALGLLGAGSLFFVRRRK